VAKDAHDGVCSGDHLLHGCWIEHIARHEHQSLMVDRQSRGITHEYFHGMPCY
jgi:hypothetical protein